jgi:hypothetical protein
MGARKKMAFSYERRIQPETPAECVADERGLDITVVFTSVPATLAALRHAAILARNLTGRITLLVPQVVPYPRPLSSPPVLIDWNERRFRAIASASPAGTAVRVYLCRDRDETLLKVLEPRSVVVIGAKRRRWPFSQERRLARTLRRAGHDAVLIETE